MQQNRQTNAKAIASLVLSCASMICCMQWSISLVMAVLGIVFGILGLRDDNPNQEDAAIAGIVVGVAGVILAIVVAVLLIKITNNSSMQHLEQTASFSPHTAGYRNGGIYDRYKSAQRACNCLSYIRWNFLFLLFWNRYRRNPCRNRPCL